MSKLKNPFTLNGLDALENAFTYNDYEGQRAWTQAAIGFYEEQKRRLYKILDKPQYMDEAKLLKAQIIEILQDYDSW